MSATAQRCVLAVDVGGSAVKFGYATSASQLQSIRTVPIQDLPQGGGVLDGIAELTRMALAESPQGLRPAAIGIVVPGIVDAKSGIGRLSIMLGWRDAPIQKRIGEASGLPVALGHDVSAAAVAEGAYGAGRGHHDWVFLALGTGLGSALMLNGVPYRGSNGWGGELSHIVVDPEGPPCRCAKRGCLEVLASASGISARFADITGETIGAAEVAARAASGHAAAEQVWDTAVSALITVLAMAVESLNPSAVIVGGGMAQAGPQLLDPLKDGLATQVAWVRPSPIVIPAELGVFAGVHGAALLGLNVLGHGELQ